MPNGNKDYQEWKVSNAEFRGFMKAKLEDISKSIDVLGKETKVQDNRLNKVENRATAVEVKGGFFGFLGGLVGGFAAMFMR